MGLWQKHLEKAAKKAEQDARKAEIRATKTFHRTGRQLTKADRAEDRAARYARSAEASKRREAGEGAPDTPRGMVRCVKNGHLLNAGKHDVCPIDGSELR